MLTIRLLGELEVCDGGSALALPPSRKTRALLAYLAATLRPHRRERLCELFWELPDDPRGALRWSLSKLRGLLDRDGQRVVAADRQTARLHLAPEQVDLLQVRTILRDGVEAAATHDLERAAALFRGPFLADLDSAPSPELQSWLAGQREEIRQLHARVLTALDDRAPAASEAALGHSRELVGLDPYVEGSWGRLVRRLVALGRRREAEEQYVAARAALADVGGPGPALEKALRGAGAAVSAPPHNPRPELRQEIRFCRASDGTRIAYALAGAGPPLVKAANWMNHVEYDWESPIWGHFFRGLARDHRLLRYDARGNGLSDWDCGELSLDAWVADLEAVVEAAGYDRFPLIGVSQGCAISVAYAVRHPEKVSHLILYAGFTAGPIARGAAAEVEQRRALITLMRLGWGQDNAAFRQVFTSTFIPEATREQADAYNELQRRTTSPEGAARYYEATGRLDVRDVVSQVNAPTLVLHAEGDARVAIERGRELTAAIRGARFVPLPGKNHLFLEDEPATPLFFDEVRRFLAE